MSEQTQAPTTNLTCSRCGYVMTARTIARASSRRPDGLDVGAASDTVRPGREGSTSGQETRSSKASVPIRRECRSHQST